MRLVFECWTRFLAYLNRSLIITKYMGFLKIQTIVQQLMLDPYNLRTTSRRNDILRFFCWGWDGMLLLALPWDQTISQKLASSWSWFSIKLSPTIVAVSKSIKVKFNIFRIPKTQFWATCEVPKNPFNNNKMREFRISLLVCALTDRKH